MLYAGFTGFRLEHDRVASLERRQIAGLELPALRLTTLEHGQVAGAGAVTS